MIEIQGKYSKGKIMTDVVDDTTMSQIYNLLNQEFTQDSKIRFMPDLHAGAGCVIGTTMTIKDKVCPNIVGVDIGCGVMVVKLGNIDIDYKELDDFIRSNIPSGFEVNSKPVEFVEFNDLKDLSCYEELNNVDRLEKSLCSLGGGNHFIEIDEDDEGNKYLLVHTGSRNLGKQVAEIHQQKAINYHKEKMLSEKQNIIQYCPPQERQQKLLKVTMPPEDLCYLEGELLDKYFNDMRICQKFAWFNRTLICTKICSFFGIKLSVYNTFESVHNYIDLEHMILRKGAISAEQDKKLIIPINMRDGAIIGVGKGNADYNYSAPHGAGRIMSRSEAKQNVSMDEFRKSMEGIYSTSVCESTLDESPMAYKDIGYVLEYIKDTVDVEKIILPVYNFKAS